MTANQWLTLAVTAITDFLITAGGAIGTVMTQVPDKLPGTAAWIAAAALGVTAAARSVQKSLAPAVSATLPPQGIRPMA